MVVVWMGGVGGGVGASLSLVYDILIYNFKTGEI